MTCEPIEHILRKFKIILPSHHLFNCKIASQEQKNVFLQSENKPNLKNKKNLAQKTLEDGVLIVIFQFLSLEERLILRQKLQLSNFDNFCNKILILINFMNSII